MVGRTRVPSVPPLPLLLALLIAWFVVGDSSLIRAPRAAAQGTLPLVEIVPLEGAITPPTARYLINALANAERRGAVAVVIELGTPGGLMSATDEIVRGLLASEVPVVVWVAPDGARAASAGVFVTYAAHVAAMSPSTRIGSASPVSLGGEMDETMRQKVTNDAVSQLRTLADLRGRDAAWAEASVRDAANVVADEALRLGVVDFIAPDLPSLLAGIDGRTVATAGGSVTIETGGAETVRRGPGLLDQVLALLADPTIAYLLLSLGGLGLFLELSNPGVTFPGVFGGISLLMGLYGLGTLPVNWAGVALIGFAFLLFVLDLFVPSFGTLTIGGLVGFVLGSYLLLGDGAPPGLAIAPAAIWTLALLLAVAFILMAILAGRTVIRRPTTGREGLIGATGTVRRTLDPDGVVFVEGELWQATAAAGPSDSGIPITVGTPVAVAAVDGLRLVVRPATAAEASAAGVAILMPQSQPDRTRNPTGITPAAAPADAS